MADSKQDLQLYSQQPNPSAYEPYPMAPALVVTQQPGINRGMSVNNNVVVMANAAPTVVAVPKPPSYIEASIFTCLFCCPIIGIMAIVYSCASENALNSNELEKARTYSDIAKKFCIAGIVNGIAIAIIIVTVRIMVAHGEQ